MTILFQLPHRLHDPQLHFLQIAHPDWPGEFHLFLNLRTHLIAEVGEDALFQFLAGALQRDSQFFGIHFLRITWISRSVSFAMSSKTNI